MLSKAQFQAEQSEDGRFLRQEDAFREWVRADGSGLYPAASGRYHLYVSLACPWAHRTIIMRRLKGLEGAIGMTVVDPIRDDRGWAFRDGPGYSTDPVNGFTFLSEAYLRTDPSFSGRVTVPVLWDKLSGRIVSNSDDDILRMLETEFEAFAKDATDYYPLERRAEIDELNAWIFETVNDGVYRAGFATAQVVYEGAAYALFEALDWLEARLATQRYLFGARPPARRFGPRSADARTLPRRRRYASIRTIHTATDFNAPGPSASQSPASLSPISLSLGRSLAAAVGRG